MKIKITLEDVTKAAADMGIPVLEAITFAQSAAAKMSDEVVLEQLCAIKEKIIFG